MKLPVTIGDYTLLDTVGAGAFGTVYRARVQGEMGFAQDVAVKVVDAARAAASPALVHALADEASFLARIQHPHIVSVRRFARVPHALFGDLWLMEMELIRGRSLKALLRDVTRARKRLPLESVFSLLLEGADALRYAHGLRGDDGRPVGLVHRDLKPDNMIVSEDGRLKVLDFGIAWAQDRIGERTDTGVAKGTPIYMSPEQARGERLDGRSDLYSLGAIAFELLTGMLYVPMPPTGTGLPGLMRAVVLVDWSARRPLVERRLSAAGDDPTPPHPELVAGLTDLLGSLLALRPEGRPADAGELLARLEELAAGLRLHVGRHVLRALAAAPGRDPSEATPGIAALGRPSLANTAPAAGEHSDSSLDPDLTSSEEVALQTWVAGVDSEREAAADGDPTQAETQMAPGFVATGVATAAASPEPLLGAEPVAPTVLAPPRGRSGDARDASARAPRAAPPAEPGPVAPTVLVPPPRAASPTRWPLALGGALAIVALAAAFATREPGPTTAPPATEGAPLATPAAEAPGATLAGDGLAASAPDEDAAGGSTAVEPGTSAGSGPAPPAPTESSDRPAPGPSSATPAPGARPPASDRVAQGGSAGQRAAGPAPTADRASPAAPEADWPRLTHTPPALLLPGNPLLVAARLDGGTTACAPELYIAPSTGPFARHALEPRGGGRWEARVPIPYDGSFDEGARYFLRCCDGPRCGPSVGSREAPLRVEAPGF